MGIVNVTPDSFSDGGLHTSAEAATQHALQLVADGADLLDIGGESTRPGADPVPEEEELRRVVPVLRAVRRQTTVPLSIDTMKAGVARAALDLGCDLVNDVSGLRSDPDMAPLLSRSRCGIVLMHMRGEPRTMQEAPHYDDVVSEVGGWLATRLTALVNTGIAADRVVLDPGIGFGKRQEDNLALLHALARLRAGGRPLLVGSSRKSFIGRLLDEPVPVRRIEGDLAVAAWCRATGVAILRVHDVRATRRFLRVLDALEAAGAPASRANALPGSPTGA